MRSSSSYKGGSSESESESESFPSTLRVVPNLLDPEALSKIQGLALRARTVVEGALAGMHRSPQAGQSIEFAEHKEYSAGDEMRHIDWRALGRVDRYYVKRYEDETDLRAYLCIDVSASMGYKGAALSKIEYASVLAASLAQVLLRQQDRVGLIAFGPDTPVYVPPRSHSGHLAALLAALEQLAPAGPTNLAVAASQIAERAHRRSVIIVLSDLLDLSRGALDGLRQLRVQQHDVSVLHVMDSDELSLPFEEPALFFSMEDERQLMADPRALRPAYLEALRQFLRQSRTELASSDIEYRLVDTSRPPARVLLDFLATRSGARGAA